jgi:hypothetical protein
MNYHQRRTQELKLTGAAASSTNECPYRRDRSFSELCGWYDWMAGVRQRIA